jgi:hypothetical protein
MTIPVYMEKQGPCLTSRLSTCGYDQKEGYVALTKGDILWIFLGIDDQNIPS